MKMLLAKLNPGTLSEKSPKQIIFILILFCLHIAVCENERHYNDGDENNTSVPKYLLNLFSKLEKERGLEGGSYRSIFPTEGGEEGTFLQFTYRPSQPVSSESSKPVFNLAELHLRTRRRRHKAAMDEKSSNPNSDIYTVEFRTIVSVEGGREIHLPLHSNRYPGWKRFDITELFQNLEGPSYTVFLRFESLPGKILPTRSVLKLFRSPFLLLQTADSTESPPNFIADFAAGEPPAVSIEVQESHPRKKRFVEIMSNIEDFDHPNNLYTIADQDDNNISIEEDLGDKGDRKKKIDKKKKKRMRKKERKMKNEVLSFYDDDYPDENENILNLDYESDDLSSIEAGQFRLKTDGDTIPYPKDYPTKNKNKHKHSGRSSQHNKQRKHKKEGKESKDGLPKFWKPLEYQISDEVLKSSETREGECKLHQYKVDLRRVGFGRRIISPKSYMANYCAGNCTFPLTRNSHPTNHATVLSILSALDHHGGQHNGGEGQPPPACCVAKKHDSLTLLYYDLDGSVVLKNYPQMSVKSCGCR